MSPRFVAPADLPKATPRDLAQAAYWQRLDTIDERLLRYSEQVTPDQIWLALRILRSFFTREAILGGLPMTGAMEFLDAEMDRAYLALSHGQKTMLPLLWVPREDLDDLEKRDPSASFPFFEEASPSSMTPKRRVRKTRSR